eukprot:TRINITY_DN1185_c0_g1_i2.p1 TRINITY_DN1185_c0_g1~~TRINITY_DN1185_c0_g1_i2.p1  ORF type:complete len:323 (+),score=47.62 TRINITY_DN1185_c0_g1_i2:119-1087(+)
MERKAPAMLASKFNVAFGVAWDRSVTAKSQTLFPVWGDKDNQRATKGVPEVADYTLRATKGVNMHPYPFVRWTDEDGSKYAEEEEIKLSIVSASTKLPPPVGACGCGTRQPRLSDSRPCQLYTRDGQTLCRAQDGLLTLRKLRIGCCTGSRGHGCLFCIRAEFVREGSPLKGIVVFSSPIQVGAKGPFANLPTPMDATVCPAFVPTAAPIDRAAVPGSREMQELLRRLNLERYIDVFLHHEVDIQAFSELREQDLLNMGISKIGPRVKILSEIQRRNDEAAGPLAASVYSLARASTFRRSPTCGSRHYPTWALPRSGRGSRS